MTVFSETAHVVPSLLQTEVWIGLSDRATEGTFTWARPSSRSPPDLFNTESPAYTNTGVTSPTLQLEFSTSEEDRDCGVVYRGQNMDDPNLELTCDWVDVSSQS